MSNSISYMSATLIKYWYIKECSAIVFVDSDLFQEKGVPANQWDAVQWIQILTFLTFVTYIMS